MKRIRFYAGMILLASAGFAACQKDKVLVLGDQHMKTGTTGEFFNIRCASMSEGMVTLDVFHGGDEAAEFSYSWDGQVTNPFPDSCTACRQIEIRVTGKGTNQGTDSLSYSQTATIKLADLNISTDDLNSGTILKIMNTSDEENPIYLYAANGIARGGECTWTIDGGDGGGEIITVDPDLIHGLPVVVVETSCDKGTWQNLWLKTDLSEPDSIKPSFTYLMPVSIYLADSLYGYTPKAGDKLTGSFKKVGSSEVCSDRIADTQPVDIITLYKR